MNLIIKESEKDFYWLDDDSNTIFSPIFDDEEKAYHWFGEIIIPESYKTFKNKDLSS